MSGIGAGKVNISSASKQLLYIDNQKELKLLVTKNPVCTPFRWKIEKTHCHFFKLHFFFLEKMCKDILDLVVAFQWYQIHWFRYNIWKETKFGEHCTINWKSYFSNVKVTEVVTQSYSIRKVFLKILQNSQGNKHLCWCLFLN